MPKAHQPHLLRALLLCISASLMASASLPATILNDWTFDDQSGTNMNAVSNTGDQASNGNPTFEVKSNGTTGAGTIPGSETNGQGQLVITSNADRIRNADIPNMTSGTVFLRLDIQEWSLLGDDGRKFDYALATDPGNATPLVGIRLQHSNSGLKIKTTNGSNTSSAHLSLGMASSEALSLIVSYDLDNDTYSLWSSQAGANFTALVTDAASSVIGNDLNYIGHQTTKLSSGTADGSITLERLYHADSAEDIGLIFDTTAPSLSSLVPTDDSSNVAPGLDLQLTFNEPVQTGSGNITIRLASDDSVIESVPVGAGSVNFDGATVRINPSSNLSESTAYYVEIDAGAIEDYAGNDFVGIGGNTAWDFTTRASGSHTNVIVILADDMGYECLRMNGADEYNTPELDTLASQGMRFTQAHVQSICTPTRVMLMTGRSNARNYLAFGTLKHDEVTIGDLMQDANYTTGLFGKWQLSGANNQRGTYPSEAGFDEWTVWNIKDGNDYKGERFWYPQLYRHDTTGQNNDDPVSVPLAELPASRDGIAYGPDVINGDVLDFIERNSSHPFFVYYTMILPHDPHVATPDSTTWPAHSGNLADINTEGSDTEQNEYFSDMIRYMSKMVGNVSDKVDELGLGNDTLIVFLADNGTNKTITTDYNHPTLGLITLQGQKSTTKPYSHRVPMITRWPGVIPAGSTSDSFVHGTDVFATLVDVAGTSFPPGITYDGASVVPDPANTTTLPVIDSRTSLFNYHITAKPKQDYKAAARFAFSERYKLYSTGEFYDMQNDLTESNDLTGSESAAELLIRADLQTEVDSWDEVYSPYDRQKANSHLLIH